MRGKRTAIAVTAASVVAAAVATPLALREVTPTATVDCSPYLFVYQGETSGAGHALTNIKGEAVTVWGTLDIDNDGVKEWVSHDVERGAGNLRYMVKGSPYILTLDAVLPLTWRQDYTYHPKPYLPIEAFTLDFNGDGIVNEVDRASLIACIGQYDQRYDVDFDGRITFDDLEYFDARLTAYNDLAVIREVVKNGELTTLTWPKEHWEDASFSCTLVGIDEDKLKAFTGEYASGQESTDLPGYSSILDVFYRDGLGMRNSWFNDWTGGLPVDAEGVGWTTQYSGGTVTRAPEGCELQTDPGAGTYAGVYQEACPPYGPDVFLYRDRGTQIISSVRHYFEDTDSMGHLVAWWDWGNGADPIKAVIRNTSGFPDQPNRWQMWLSTWDEDLPAEWHTVPMDATRAVFHVVLEGDAGDSYTASIHYTDGACGGRFVCEEFGKHMMIQAYKALGYGYILYASSSGHAYNMFWVGGDWQDLHNWRIYEPGQGRIIDAVEHGWGSRYKTNVIAFPEIAWVDTYPIPGHTVQRCRHKLLAVNHEDESVSYVADGVQHIFRINSFGVSVPETFN